MSETELGWGDFERLLDDDLISLIRDSPRGRRIRRVKSYLAKKPKMESLLAAFMILESREKPGIWRGGPSYRRLRRTVIDLTFCGEALKLPNELGFRLFSMLDSAVWMHHFADRASIEEDGASLIAIASYTFGHPKEAERIATSRDLDMSNVDRSLVLALLRGNEGDHKGAIKLLEPYCPRNWAIVLALWNAYRSGDQREVARLLAIAPGLESRDMNVAWYAGRLAVARGEWRRFLRIALASSLYLSVNERSLILIAKAIRAAACPLIGRPPSNGKRVKSLQFPRPPATRRTLRA